MPDERVPTINLRLPVTKDGNKVWDITEKFTRAAAALETGQLIKDEYFTLFESVGALEIMDPKMDSGFLRLGETLEDEYDVSRDLLPDEVIGIMDQFLSYEMAWHEGYPLSQTLLTSLYIERLLWPSPKTLDDARFIRFDGRGASGLAQSLLHTVLRAFCLGLVKSCDLVIQRIVTREYFEEEDFCTMTYHRDLLSGFPEEEVDTVLAQALQWLSDSTLPESLSDDMISAIRVRLDFRKKFLEAITPSKPASSTQDLWAAMIDQLKHFNESHSLGKPVPEAFSHRIQRRLASTVPPRPIVDFTFEEAIEKLILTCSHCQETSRLAKCQVESSQNLLAITRVFGSRKPHPLAFARAYFCSGMFCVERNEYENLLRKDVEEIVLRDDPIMDPVNWSIEAPQSSGVPKDPRLAMSQVIDDFCYRASCYLEFWSALCQNRCRMRRMLSHTIRAFDDLQAECEVFDEDLRQVAPEMQISPLSLWSYHQKLRQMEWVTQLGFEQDVYLPDELGGMYWWLARLSEIRSRLLEQMILPAIKHRRNAIAQNKIKIKHAKVEQMSDMQSFIETLLHEAHGTSALADSLSVLYIVLAYHELIPAPPRPYGEAALRYELRMKPFLRIGTPSPPDYEGFCADMQPCGMYDNPAQHPSIILAELGPRIESWMQEAKAAFTALKKLGPSAAKATGVEHAWNKAGFAPYAIKDVSNVLLSCIAVGVTLAGLRGTFAKSGYDMDPKPVQAILPEVDKRYHDAWVVPKIVSR
ncbi:Mak10-domain-containing protein [Patellaria atrata CBS 101060]|uniref:Mak10-domain-containing protein n=1 Tax=Patellaria atrata CBS 101060 TaxID=1346257 RepID=A0A9P4S6Z2_9PEZI|nr:Mak10-domain-containing protein [Patellaria atrata CBS 101060]